MLQAWFIVAACSMVFYSWSYSRRHFKSYYRSVLYFQKHPNPNSSFIWKAFCFSCRKSDSDIMFNSMNHFEIFILSEDVFWKCVFYASHRLLRLLTAQISLSPFKIRFGCSFAITVSCEYIFFYGMRLTLLSCGRNFTRYLAFPRAFQRLLLMCLLVT